MLLLEFVAVTLVVFLPLALLWRPAPERLAVVSRFGEIRSSRSKGSDKGAGLANLLRPAEAPRFRLLERIAESSWLDGLRLLVLQADTRRSCRAQLGVCALVFAAALALLLAVGASAWLAIAAACGAGYAPFLLLRVKRGRRLRAFERALPDAVEMMARSLRAGHSIVAAIGILAEHAAEPLAAEFAEVFRRQNFGVPVRDALLALVERVPSQDLRVVVTGILVQKDTGGNLADVLSRTVLVVRERQRLQGEVRTHTAQGRITGWILCALPPALLLIINIANPGYSHVLFVDATGRKLLYLGLLLLAIGSLWIRSIVQGIEV